MTNEASLVDESGQSVKMLQDLLQHERAARVEAEAIAERGLRELYERKEQIQLLGAIAFAAHNSESLEEVFEFTLRSICESCGWPHGNAYLTRFKNGAPVMEPVSAWIARDEPKLRQFRDLTFRTTFSAQSSLPGRVLTTGDLCWIADLSRDTSFIRGKDAVQAGLYSGFAFPILSGDDVIAVLEFFSYHSMEPDKFLVDLIWQVGLQLGRIVERKRIQDHLAYEATHDSLTGLPDRSMLMDRLTLAIHRLRIDPASRFALLLIDLNRFKLINNSVGHTLGDGLIAQVAGRFSDALRGAGITARPTYAGNGDREVLCRFGGDEFALLLESPGSDEGVEEVCRMLQQCLDTPFRIQEREIFLTISIGIAFSASALTSPTQVVQDVDLAMQRAKKMGRKPYVFYEPSLSASLIDRLEIESSLRRALNRKEFVLHYQPIVRLATARIVGFEALIRWNKPGVGLISPGDFIHVAEESGLIIPIGEWVMAEACRTAHRWHMQFNRKRPFSIGVNLSARQFSQTNLVQQVAGLLEETGIWPGSLLFEITESVSMEDIDRTIAVLKELAMIGIRATVDDFGTGFSSLSYLHRLPTNVLKIDRSFVTRMDEDRDSRAIVMTIINLARDLGMDVVAEGIETEGQAELLRDYECKYGQGYFFSEPLSEQDASRLLETALLDEDD